MASVDYMCFFFLGARMMSRLACYYLTFREKERGGRESKRVREKRQRHRDRESCREIIILTSTTAVESHNI